MFYLGSLQDILIKGRQDILLDRPSNRLQRLVRLTLRVVVFHILERSKARLNRDIIALVPRIRDRLPDGRSNDVRLAILLIPN